MGIGAIGTLYRHQRRAGWHALHGLVRRMWAARVQRQQRHRARDYLAKARRSGQSGAPDPATLAAHLDKWSGLGRPVYADFYRAYRALSGVDCADYVPDDIFYTIVEPALNDHRLGAAYSDKGMSEIVLESSDFPDTVVRNFDGRYYDREFGALSNGGLESALAGLDRVVVKPSLETGSGHNVRIFSRENGALRTRAGETLSEDGLNALYRGNFVIQRYIEQHPYLAALNPSSVNCFRFFTYRSVVDDEVAILAATLKIGGAGAEIDNWAAGGIDCGLDADGRPNSRGFSADCRWHDTVPSSGRRFVDLEPIPSFGRAREVAIRTARKMRYSRVLGFDMCIDAQGRPRIVEINNRFIGIFSHQVKIGGLFGAYTDEVIAHCKAHPRPIVGVFI